MQDDDTARRPAPQPSPSPKKPVNDNANLARPPANDNNDPIKRAALARKGSPFLNTAQAAFYIGIKERTLEEMRRAGRGPFWRLHARFIRYHIDDLDEWSRTNGHGPKPPNGSSTPPTTSRTPPSPPHIRH
jgi:hypothetical protein